MDLAALEQTVMRDEGFRRNPYLCSAGYPTQGYGSRTMFGRLVTLASDPVTTEQARIQLRADLYQAILDAQALFERFNELNDARQEVLISMAYVLGRSGLANFKRLRGAAWMLRYELMADEIEDSRMYRQIGNRGARLVEQMRTGKRVDP